jgi:uncharacterized protein YkwD
MTNLSRRALALAGVGALVAACADPRRVDRTPVFYRDLSMPGATVDQRMAAAMITDHRRNHGLGPVVADARLSEIARDLAAAMAARDEVRESLRAAPLNDRLRRRGYTVITTADETVSAGYRTLAEAFSGWRSSPSHDRIMRLRGATQLGIATVPAPSSRFRVYWALVMADAR